MSRTTLMDIVQSILNLRIEKNTSEEMWEMLQNRYINELTKCTDSDELRQILSLNLDKLMDLPIDVVIQTYEKYLTYERDARTIRSYATYLLLFGPDWDEYAQTLLNEIDEHSH